MGIGINQSGTAELIWRGFVEIGLRLCCKRQFAGLYCRIEFNALPTCGSLGVNWPKISGFFHTGFANELHDVSPNLPETQPEWLIYWYRSGPHNRLHKLRKFDRRQQLPMPTRCNVKNVQIFHCFVLQIFWHQSDVVSPTSCTTASFDCHKYNCKVKRDALATPFDSRCKFNSTLTKRQHLISRLITFAAVDVAQAANNVYN